MRDGRNIWETGGGGLVGGFFLMCSPIESALYVIISSEIPESWGSQNDKYQFWPKRSPTWGPWTTLFEPKIPSICLDIYGFLHQDVNSRHLGSVWNKLLSSLIRNRYLVGRSGGGSRLPCYVFFRHASVSSTYPCQSVGWSYFWISIAHEHFCATVVFDDPPPPQKKVWVPQTRWPTWWLVTITIIQIRLMGEGV